MCDHCRSNRKFTITVSDITSLCQDVFAIIDHANSKEHKLTLLKLLDAWFQTGSKDLRAPSVKKPNITREKAENVIAFMLLKGYLKEDKNYTAYTVNCYIQRNLSKIIDKDVRIEIPWKCCVRKPENNCENDGEKDTSSSCKRIKL